MHRIYSLLEEIEESLLLPSTQTYGPDGVQVVAQISARRIDDIDFVWEHDRRFLRGWVMEAGRNTWA